MDGGSYIGDPVIMIMATRVIVTEEANSMLLGAAMLGMLLLLIMMFFSDSDNLDLLSGDSTGGEKQHATRSSHAWDGSWGGRGASSCCQKTSEDFKGYRAE